MQRLSSIRKIVITALVLYCIPTNLRAWCDISVCAQSIRNDERLFTEPETLVEQSLVSTHQNFIPWTEPIPFEEARSAIRQAKRLIASDHLGDALLQLRIAEQAFPLVADHIALVQADVLLKMHEPREACRAFAIARKSLNHSIAAQGRVGSVYCRLKAGDRTGEKLLQQLLRRYPKMPDIPRLRFALAQARESWKNTWGAIRLYQAIYLVYPESPFAEKAKQALERIKSQGTRIRRYTFEELIGRAERLVFSGPIEQANQALQEIIDARLPTPQIRARVHALAARLARKSGRWSVAKNEVIQARSQGVPVPDVGKYMPPKPRGREIDDSARAERIALSKIRQIRGGKVIRRLRNMKLIAILRIALDNQLTETAEEVLRVMRNRKSLGAKQRFRSAMLATGSVSDEIVAGLLYTLIAVPRYRVAARYHYARALERLGRFDEADAEYSRVISRDRSSTRYYAMWAELRRWTIKSELTLSCIPDSATYLANKKKNAPSSRFSRISSKLNKREKRIEIPLALDPNSRKPRSSSDANTPRRSGKSSTRPITAEQIRKLESLVQIHGSAYPWLGRALDLVRLGQLDAAADELYETYLAWRDVRGGLRLRSGIQTIFTGAALPRRPFTFKLRRERLALNPTDRLQLAELATALGDVGTAVRFNPELISKRPRAYATEVEKAAKAYGLDPNLLFAVMRVESIYNRRIISHAGAIGLMQIMPRTGRLIANELGIKDFGLADLLDHRTSLRFAAWYLSSLLHRFDGRTPLAVAAYNGGPHNVRAWIYRTNPQTPLDAFLERIPLSETHRYVRRVLTHYAAYRAQQGLPMERLSVSLPEVRKDPIGF